MKKKFFTTLISGAAGVFMIFMLAGWFSAPVKSESISGADTLVLVLVSISVLALMVVLSLVSIAAVFAGAWAILLRGVCTFLNAISVETDSAWYSPPQPGEKFWFYLFPASIGFLIACLVFFWK